MTHRLNLSANASWIHKHDWLLHPSWCVCPAVEFRLYREILCFLFHLNLNAWMSLVWCSRTTHTSWKALFHSIWLCVRALGNATLHPGLPFSLTAILPDDVVDCLLGSLNNLPVLNVCVLIPLEWQPWLGLLVLLPATEWRGEHLGNQQQKSFFSAFCVSRLAGFVLLCWDFLHIRTHHQYRFVAVKYRRCSSSSSLQVHFRDWF